MTDVHSRETRSFNMSCIHGLNTKLEDCVRKYLFSRGLRYRKNDKRYPGKPDLVFPKYHVIVFVNGCFWHKHTDCRYFILPKTNTEYWAAKLESNCQRDERNIAQLHSDGWHVIVVWECELKKALRNERLDRLFFEITRNKLRSIPKTNRQGIKK